MLLLLSSVTVVVRDDDDDGDGGGSFAENERVLLLLRAEAGFCHPCCSSFWLREDFCSFLVRMVGWLARLLNRQSLCVNVMPSIIMLVCSRSLSFSLALYNRRC